MLGSNKKAIRIAILGPEGTFSQDAAEKYHKNRLQNATLELLFKKSIFRAFKSVEDDEADLGIVPVENQLEGSIGATLDKLYESELIILGEVSLHIHHFFAAKDRSADIKSIISNSVAIAQCSGFLNKSYPDADITNAASTAEAMRIIAENKMPGFAAIGSESAVKRYGLEILAENIEDNNVNITNFIVIGKKSFEHGKNTLGKFKTSISVKPSVDKPGLLCDILYALKKQSINLTKIQSRPSGEKLGNYIFFIDLIGHAQDENVALALNNIKDIAEVKIFGSYHYNGD
ncbi:MAG: prephenate dehydratase [Nanoarchaeota archaeon]|nr:prephenate dehydratase [Nanoarchaeota archaeon]